MDPQMPPHNPYHSPASPSGPPVVPPRTSGFAISSLVTAIFGLAIVPVILGHIALSKIKKAAGSLQGRGLAIAGLVLGYLQIAAFILLIPALFIGARAWKKGSDRAVCILNQRNVQQAVRGYQELHDLKSGDPIPWAEIVGPGKLLEQEPVCPALGEYEYMDRIPERGTLVITCSKADAEQHVPKDFSGW
jgi:hypothetical protein